MTILESICQLSRQAGVGIMTIYQQAELEDIRFKVDNSPVTAADLAAHQIIVQGLSELTPEIPILSEEDPHPWNVRRHWQRYWLVDPLDGTKEFIKRNGEFTVNIALIEQGIAVMGVIYAPVGDLLYFAVDGQAWKEVNGQRSLIHAKWAKPPTVVTSRSQPTQALNNYLTHLGEHQRIRMGSSLKFCLIAEGQAQLYPRFGATSIWDTAAGQAIANAAGAKVTDWQGNPLKYDPQPSLINPEFLVSLAD